MAAKYYTHFVTASERPRQTHSDSEWSGVVELRYPLEYGSRELRSLLARSFDLSSDEIRILDWARLH